VFHKKVKLIVTLHQNGPTLGDQVIQEATALHEAGGGDKIVYGTDLVYLGYKPYPALVINSLGQDFHISFPADYYNTSIDSLPLTQRVHNLTDVKAIINISGTSDRLLDFVRSLPQRAPHRGDGVMATTITRIAIGRVFGLMGA
jgi:hypothetical protein